jgi:hypothetical protein
MSGLPFIGPVVGLMELHPELHGFFHKPFYERFIFCQILKCPGVSQSISYNLYISHQDIQLFRMQLGGMLLHNLPKTGTGGGFAFYVHPAFI